MSSRSSSESLASSTSSSTSSSSSSASSSSSGSSSGSSSSSSSSTTGHISTSSSEASLTDHLSDDSAKRTIAADFVVTKYRMAGAIVNRVLQQLIDKCVVDASIRELCALGDASIEKETSKTFKRVKAMKKGIAFPTCISVNNCACHFSPLLNEDDYILKDDDVVKIELGAHIDGFIALVAHTIVIGASKTRKVTGKRADAILAAHYASQGALRILKPGNETDAVSNVVEKICELYHCKAIEGMASYKLRQFKINGGKPIIPNATELQKETLEFYTFQVHEVFAMDVLSSSGDGTIRENRTRGTVFKKSDISYQLKMKTSRIFYSEVVKKYSTMPFHLRAFEDEKKAKLGIIECLSHNVVESYPVHYEKVGEFTARFRFTVLLLPKGPLKITGLPFEPEFYESEYSYSNDPHIDFLLRQTGNPRRAIKKKIKKNRKLGLAY